MLTEYEEPHTLTASQPPSLNQLEHIEMEYCPAYEKIAR